MPHPMHAITSNTVLANCRVMATECRTYLSPNSAKLNSCSQTVGLAINLAAPKQEYYKLLSMIDQASSKWIRQA